jgi:RHS repeat-associated protein
VYRRSISHEPYEGGAFGGGQAQVWFGGKLIQASGQRVVQDRLGTVTVQGGERMRYWPYGEERETAARKRQKWATYWRDESGLDYAMARYQQNGRFLSPDPYVGSGGPGVPQSWNRYAYVQNDPVNFYDPPGLYICNPNGPLCGQNPFFGGGGGGDSNSMEVVNSDPGGGGGSDLTPRELMLQRREQVRSAIYGTGDAVFGSEVLDCIAGKESAWYPRAENQWGFRGMFQIGEEAWKDAYRNSRGGPSYLPNVFDPGTSAATAAVILNRFLVYVVGLDRYSKGDYSDADKIEAIGRYNGSSSKDTYKREIWECSQKMKAGDLEGAFAAIGK